MAIGDHGGIGAGKSRRSGRRGARPLAEILEGRQLLATITVNTTGDADGADGGTTLSLRQAIEVANGTLAVGSLTASQTAQVVGALSTPDTIDFDIPGTGPFTIAPTATMLPAVTVPVVIDGYSQPGAHANTNGPGQADNAVIEVEITGRQSDFATFNTAPYYGSGLVLSGGDSTIQGLELNRFGGVGEAEGEHGPIAFLAGGGIVLDTKGGDVVQGNFLGTDVTGTVPAGNQISGAGIYDNTPSGSGDVIGGTTPSARNVVGVGEHAGVTVIPTSGVTIEGNFIGADVSGTRSLTTPEYFGGGIESDSGSATNGGNLILDNLISGNYGEGLSISGGQVRGNLIGTDLTGTRPLGNGGGGIAIGVGATATVGGTTASARNVISGNGGAGINVNNEFAGGGEFVLPPTPSGLPQAVLIEGNFIGTDVTGTVAIGNAVGGIEINGSGQAAIGGTAPGAGNVISGNMQDGILTDESTVGDLIQGNLIGVDASGERPLPNARFGINFQGGSSTIGGTAAGAGNVISGNASAGLVITSQPLTFVFQPSRFVLVPAVDNLVQGNFIGTDRAGTTPLGNGGDGVDVSGSSNTIGGQAAGAGNLIASNKGAGVAVTLATFAATNSNIPGAVAGAPIIGSGLTNLISANAISGNGGLGIDLGLDGVTPNNPAGSADGPNHLQPYPVLTSAYLDATSSVITATLDALPSTTYAIEFFSNPPGTGQGQVYLGSTLTTTDAGGHASFGFAAPVAAGQSVTATATDPEGDTSEFSGDIAVSPAPPPPTPPSLPATTTTLIGPASPSTAGQPVAFAAVVTSASGTIPTGFVLFGSAGVILGEVPLDAQGVALFYTRDLPVGVDVVAAAYLSDASNPASLSNYVLADVNFPAPIDTGPTVASARVASSTSVKVAFSSPLQPGPAQDTANYAILDPEGRALAIQSANYHADDDSVTLRTRQKLNPQLPYLLIVNGVRPGRVVDIHGVALDGLGDGRPGSTFVGAIAPQSVTASGHPSGPKASALAHEKGR